MESTLSLKLSDLTGAVGFHLGHGLGADNGDTAWTATQTYAINSCIKSGLRQFYFPAPINGVSYDWSFLRPIATLTLASGGSVVVLPDDFGGIEGQVTLLSTSSQASWPIDVVGEGKIRESFSVLPDATGRPLMTSIVPLKGTGATQGQRYQMTVYPTADQDYRLQFEYYVLADYLTGALPYALGGMAHAETILESCLAIAEERIDDASAVHSQKFQERLAASIATDRRCKPQKLGYNGDDSDARNISRRDLYEYSRITYAGQQY